MSQLLLYVACLFDGSTMLPWRDTVRQVTLRASPLFRVRCGGTVAASCLTSYQSHHACTCLLQSYQ